MRCYVTLPYTTHGGSHLVCSAKSARSRMLSKHHLTMQTLKKSTDFKKFLNAAGSKNSLRAVSVSKSVRKIAMIMFRNCTAQHVVSLIS